MEFKEVKTFWCKIYISGSREIIEQICRRECLRGLCVNIKETKFIYTGGEEVGVEIGLINYPRFPTTAEDLWLDAVGLAINLLSETYQKSALVMSPTLTSWITRDMGGKV